MNTVVSGFMEHTNKIIELAKEEGISKDLAETLLILLAPVTPHISEELWKILGHKDSIFNAKWPEYDEAKLIDDEITIIVQFNGKLRGNVVVPKDITKDDVLALVKKEFADKLEGIEIVKEIYVPGKIVNLVIKG